MTYSINWPIIVRSAVPFRSGNYIFCCGTTPDAAPARRLHRCRLTETPYVAMVAAAAAGVVMLSSWRCIIVVVAAAVVVVAVLLNIVTECA